MNRTSAAHTGARIVLVTGGCGYLGSQLIRDLATDPRLGEITVRILDNLQSGQYQALMNLPQAGRYEFVEGDILDPAALRLALQDVDAVIHLAAVAHTPLSFEHPHWVEQVNHWGTVRLVEACLDARVPRLLYASSAVVYGPGGPYRESDVCHPLGPYAHSKRQAELSILAAAARGLQPTVLRFGTLFGYAPAMRFAAVANRFAYLAGVGRSLTVYGDGTQTRPVIHVGDASDAIRFVLSHETKTAGKVFNVVGENASVHDLVAAVRVAKPEAPVHYAEQDVLTHLSFAVDGSTLARLGWAPRFATKDGMAEVIARFRNIAGGPIGSLRVEDDA